MSGFYASSYTCWTNVSTELKIDEKYQVLEGPFMFQYLLQRILSLFLKLSCKPNNSITNKQEEKHSYINYKWINLQNK